MADAKPLKVGSSGFPTEMGGTDTVPTAQLGSGTANSGTFLRGDQTWATGTGGDSPGGSDGQVQYRVDSATLGGSPLWRVDANTLAQYNSTTAQAHQIFATRTDASNYERLELIPGAAAGWMQIAARSAGTGAANVGVAFTPYGTGALSAQVPDSTTTGGNARGASSVDWQRTRNAATQVASGANSTLGGGYRNTVSAQYATVVGGDTNVASGQSSVAGGSGNTASGMYSTAFGGSNATSATGSWVPGGSGAVGLLTMMSWSWSCGWTLVKGEAQQSGVMTRATTTSTSAVYLTVDNSGTRGDTTSFQVLVNSGGFVTLTVTALHAAGAAVGAWKIEFALRRGASGLAIVEGTPVVTTIAVSAALGTPTFAIDVSHGTTYSLRVTPANSTATNWVCVEEMVRAVKA